MGEMGGPEDNRPYLERGRLEHLVLDRPFRLEVTLEKVGERALDGRREWEARRPSSL